MQGSFQGFLEEQQHLSLKSAYPNDDPPLPTHEQADGHKNDEASNIWATRSMVNSEILLFHLRLGLPHPDAGLGI